MSDSQPSSVPETPTPGGNLDIANWAALLPSFSRNELPETWQARGLLFERRERHQPLRKGGKTSPIWSVGAWYTANDGLKEHEAWLCSRCQCFIHLHSGSASNAVSHWTRVHREVDLPGLTSRSRQGTPQSQAVAARPAQRQLYQDVNIDLWRAKLMRWLIYDHVPFAQVESEWWRSVMTSLHPPIADYLVGRTTVRRWLDEEFKLAKGQVEQWLFNAASRVHISFDIWTAPNGYAMLGVYGHFVSSHSATVVQALLALRRLEGGHSGEEVALVLVSIIKEWQLEARLGVFVADNAEANDVTVKYIVAELLPAIEPQSRRSRCLGHIINLAAKAFLFGKDVEAFEMMVNISEVGLESSMAQKAQAEWREKGPVGKIHNIVQYIRSSTLRREAFRGMIVGDSNIDDLELRPDNATRWNSTYYMLRRALKCEERVRRFVRHEKYASDLAKDKLSDDDWEHLQAIADGLKPFHNATQRAQGTGAEGHHGSIWEAIPILEYLLKHLEKGVRPAGVKRRPTPLEVACQNAWEKIRKYYEKTDDCHEIYAAGLLFHPCHRQGYFDSAWTEEEEIQIKERMLRNVKSVWSTQYCSNNGHTEQDEKPAKRQKRDRSPDEIQRHLQSTYKDSTAATVADNDFDAYVTGGRLELEEVTNVISWWVNQRRWTALKQQALDVLSIPAMSTACERLFSSAGDLVGMRRHSLHDDTMERLECLRQWLQNDLVQMTGEI